MADDYGLEILYELERSRLKTETDVLVLLAHWHLTKQAGLKCIGSGDTTSCGDPSELLPADWNADGSVYSLKYQDADNHHQFILKVLCVDEAAVMSLLRTTDQKNTDLTLTPSTYISSPTDYRTTLGRRSELMTRLSNDLIQPLLPDQKKEKEEEERRRREQAEARQKREQEDNDPLRIRSGRPGIDPRMPDWSGQPAPPIGSSDLDPLGRLGGGGMLMDPRGGRHRDIEPRWDPVGPMGPLGPLGPGRGGRGGRGGLGGPRGSNWGDDMPPPGWDMYM